MWNKETSKNLWKEKGVEKPMFYSLIISNAYIIALLKNSDLVMNKKSLIQFLAFWYRVAKHHPTIFACL